jgi:transcriptional regulator with XRE-family HTH domain
MACMSAGRLLKYARRRSGLSQRALAEAAGVPQSTVARIELGVLSPRTDTLERLLRVAGQTLATEPRIGVGVDRSLIHELLRLTPAQRLRLLTADARALRMLDRAVIRGR